MIDIERRSPRPAGETGWTAGWPMRRIGSIIVLSPPAAEPPVEQLTDFGQYAPDELWSACGGGATRWSGSGGEPGEGTVPGVTLSAPESDGVRDEFALAAAEVRAVATAVVEVVVARRAVGQLRHCATAAVRRVLGSGRGHRSFGETASLRKLRVTFPVPTAAESAALVQDRDRVRVVALRCERVGGRVASSGPPRPRWLCTDVRIG